MQILPSASPESTPESTPSTNGFPEGYFIIRSIGSSRVLDVASNSTHDGSEVILYPETEKSLVESIRRPESNNQVFFIDYTGVLCSKASGHAIDIEDGHLVLRHRRPVVQPFPSAFSHPFPQFSFNSDTGEISVLPALHDGHGLSANSSGIKRRLILTAVPQRKPRTVIDDAAQFFNATVATPISNLFGNISESINQMTPDLNNTSQSLSPTPLTPPRTPSTSKSWGFPAVPFLPSPFTSSTSTEALSRTDLDLREDELLEEDRLEAEEADDSAELTRQVRVISQIEEGDESPSLSLSSLSRRQWVVQPILKAKASRFKFPPG